MQKKLFGGLMAILLALGLSQTAPAEEIPPVPAYRGEIMPVEGTVIMKLAPFPSSEMSSWQESRQNNGTGWTTGTQEMSVLSQARLLDSQPGLVEVQLDIVKMVNNGRRLPLDLTVKIAMTDLGEVRDVGVSSKTIPNLPPEISNSFKQVFGSIKGHFPADGLQQGSVIHQSMTMSGLTVAIEKTLVGRTRIGNREALVFNSVGRDANGLFTIAGYEVMDLENAATHLSETMAVAKQNGVLLLTQTERKELDASAWPAN